YGSATPPAGIRIGFYGGGGVGLSQTADEVNLYDAGGGHVTGVAFGASGTPAFASFDNAAGVGSATLPDPTISTFSVAGTNGAYSAPNTGLSGTPPTEIGSPGTTSAHANVSEVAPWGSGNTPYAADWFEVTNTGILPIDLTNWKMDDSSNLL